VSRVILVLSVAAVMAVMMAFAGPAFAQESMTEAAEEWILSRNGADINDMWGGDREFSGGGGGAGTNSDGGNRIGSPLHLVGSVDQCPLAKKYWEESMRFSRAAEIARHFGDLEAAQKLEEGANLYFDLGYSSWLSAEGKCDHLD
jgi:hypothetical protein